MDFKCVVVVAAVCGTMLTGWSNAWAEQCNPKDVPSSGKSLGESYVFTGRCDSLFAVLGKLFGGKKTGGRQLEANGKVDRAAAMREIDKARADPAIAAQLENIRNNEADPMRAMVLEAALYRDKRLFVASDFVIEELKAKLQ